MTASVMFERGGNLGAGDLVFTTSCRRSRKNRSLLAHPCSRRQRGRIPLLIHQQFDEIQVFEGVAERTGTTVHRDIVRRSKALCGSLTELTRKARSMGDGYFYLAALLWPENTTQLVLRANWVPIR